MKNTLKRIAQISLILFITISLFSCDKDDEKLSKTQYFKVKIDGVEHPFKNSVFVNKSSLNIGLITITPSDDSGKTISIVLAPENKNVEVTGTFTKEFTAGFLIDGVSGVWDADLKDRTITILTNNSEYIEGTFSFTGHNAVDNSIKKFTEGNFKIRK